LLAAATAVFLATPFAPAQNDDGLLPGVSQTYEHPVPVNLVFVGYSREQVDLAALLAELPAAYDPQIRFPRFYGLPGRPLGIRFPLQYRPLFASHDFEDRLFAFLSSSGTAAGRTLFQQIYNDQQNNVLDVSDSVLYIDAPETERWLQREIQKHHKIEIDRAYTVFFLNWYGRTDFQHHVYTKTGEPDPDTDYNFGEARSSRKMIAWGGSHGRTWFHDLSAGPDAWTANYIVDQHDLDGNGIEDYRLPAIWEYATPGYRVTDQLSRDLGLLTRFVAINLLFTPSPLYDPLNTQPDLRGNKVVHVDMLEDDPAEAGMNWLKAEIVQQELQGLQPYYDWSLTLRQLNPIDVSAQLALQIFTGNSSASDCWNNYGTPFAQMFCYFNSNRALYVPSYYPQGYVVDVFAFNTTDAGMGGRYGLLGFADDNWSDGTQSHVFEFGTPGYRGLGYGFTNTTIHEVGHHIGLSHPHDGFDPELGVDYGAQDEFYLAWTGDESESVMHYLQLSTGFGQFNHDSLHRYETTGYLNEASRLLGLIQAHPSSLLAAEAEARAQAAARRAQRHLGQWQPREAARAALESYRQLARAAQQLGIDLQARSLAKYPTGIQPLHEGCRMRFPNS
jgi:hypothetical protein